MLVFLDFEASSLSKQSYPIEVAWVFEDGAEEAHLIRPAPGWDEWDPAAEAIHHIPRAMLMAQGTPHDLVAARMVDVLTGHDLLASAPSWDGKWLSVLLRGAGLPRHSLRLRDSDEAHAQAVRVILAERFSGEELAHAVNDVLTLTEVRDGHLPAHRALADARAERQRWLDVQAAARARLK
jgi:hypothetical protein